MPTKGAQIVYCTSRIIRRRPLISASLIIGTYSVFLLLLLQIFSFMPSEFTQRRVQPTSTFSPAHIDKPHTKSRTPVADIMNMYHPDRYEILINEEKLCMQDKKTFMLICVMSSLGNFDRRDAIRQTWASHDHVASYKVKVIFLLGTTSNSLSHQMQVLEESRRYKDIIQANFMDTYYNLTLKTITALRWTSQYCPQAQYLLKTDDDIFINVPDLVTYLEKHGKPRTILGCIKQIAAPQPIWNVPAIFPPTHPLFVAGAGYVISSDLIQSLHKASHQLPLFPIEDVFITAHCAQAIGAHPPLHHHSFTCGEAVKPCHMKHRFTAHRVSPAMQYQMWNVLSNPTNQC